MVQQSFRLEIYSVVLTLSFLKFDSISICPERMFNIHTVDDTQFIFRRRSFHEVLCPRRHYHRYSV